MIIERRLGILGRDSTVERVREEDVQNRIIYVYREVGVVSVALTIL